MSELDTFFKYGFKEMIKEINNHLLSNYEASQTIRKAKQPKLNEFHD